MSSTRPRSLLGVTFESESGGFYARWVGGRWRPHVSDLRSGLTPNSPGPARSTISSMNVTPARCSCGDGKDVLSLIRADGHGTAAVLAQAALP